MGSYLSNRIKVVKIRNELSTEINILSAAPQGSHLGPLLFSIYVNDISDIIKFSNLVIYADDVKIFNVINSPMDCSKIQEDLNNVFAWACSNGLNLNIKKFNSISFTYTSQPSYYDYKINNTSLSRVYEIKDLGVILDSNLTLENHINYIVSKASKTVGFIYKFSSDFRNCQTLLTLYKTLVLPLLTYCCQIWRPFKKYLIEYLESVQHRFLRLAARTAKIFFHRFDHDYTNIMRILKIHPIDSIMDYHDVLLSYRIINGFIGNHDLSDLFIERNINYNLRNPRSVVETTSIRFQIYYSAKNRLPRAWNIIPNLLKSLGLDSFKSKCRLTRNAFLPIVFYFCPFIFE